MKRLKFVGTTALLLTASALLTGCGGDQSGQNQPSFSSAPRGDAGTDTLSEVQESGTLTVGVKFDTRPFGFVPEGQSAPDGFDVDLAEEFGRRLGVDVEFVQVNSQNRIPNLETGRVDMILASMIHTAEREQTIDFSIDYFSDEQLLLVPAGSPIGGVEDLTADTTVSLAQGGFEEAALRAAAPDAKVLTYQGWPEALQAMIRGEADAVTSTLGLLHGLAESAEDAGVEVTIVGDGFADGPVGAGFRKGDDALREAFDEALVEMVEDGTYAEIFATWWSGLMDEPFAVDTSAAGS